MNKFTKWFKKHFVPHEHNQYEPHFLRHKSISLFLLLVLVIELGFLSQIYLVFDKTKFLAAVLPSVLTELTNKERAEINLPTLNQNELLTKAAELKAEDMARNGYFAHTSPDGKTPWYWLEQVGYKYSSAGENLAVNFFESSEVEQAWMNSPTHKANIIKPNYQEIGIGVAHGIYQGRRTVFVAQFFGTPFAYANVPSPTETIPTSVAPTIPAKNTLTKPVTPPKTTPKINPTPIIPTTIPTQLAVRPIETVVLGEETINPASNTSSKINMAFIKQKIEKLLTSPIDATKYLYGIIILLFTFALTLFIRSELRHPLVIVRTLSLIAIIVFLQFINMNTFSTQTIVPNDLSANAISIIAN